MKDITLYTNPNSRGQIAHWLLEELKQPYDTVWLSFGEKGTKSADYLQVNPMGKIPTVVHKGQVITEAAAICLYFADVFPEAGLLPPKEKKAEYYRWILFAAGPVEHAVTSKAMKWQVPADRTSTVGFGTFDQTIGTLEAHFAHNDYVCGQGFTAADVYVGSAVNWGLAFGTMPKLPALVNYAERLQKREGYRRCTAINDDYRKSQG